LRKERKEVIGRKREIGGKIRVETPISRREKERLQLSGLRTNWEISSLWVQEVFGKVFVSR
jgi:hypothetical protein